MATPRKTITLADLTTEDRKRLLEQAREETKRHPRDVEGYADLSERERGFRELMNRRHHVEGCPVDVGTELGRIEGYDGRIPPDPAIGRPERYVGIVRCCECGGATVLDDPIEPALERALEELAEPAGVTAGGEDGPDNDL